MGQYLKQIVVAAMVTMGLGLLVFSHTVAGPPSCADFNDPGAVFCDNFDDGDLEGWGDGAAHSPGLNGSKFGLQLFTPEAHAMPIYWGGYKMFVPNGGKYWVEWRGSYDSNFRWKVACWTEPDGIQYCNSAHKTLDLRNTEPGGVASSNRALMTVWDGGGDGSKGVIWWSWFTGGRELTANVDPNFLLLPGKTYHFILEVTNAAGTAGAYKFWVDGRLLFDVQNIQTCTNPAGCTWNSIALGGAQAGVAPGGNYQYFDDIRITRTNIAGWATPPDTVPPAAPKNPKVVQ